jgi:hypothetical protein
MALKKAKKTKKSATKKKPAKLAKKKTIKRAVKRVISEKKPALKKKVAKKKVSSKKTTSKKIKTAGNLIGSITHYFPHVRAAVIKLKSPLSVGDNIEIKGHTTDFKQSVVSMQIDRVVVNSAKIGQEIGLLVESRVRQHDQVFKI